MEFPQAFLRTTRRARKEHRCCECLGTIQKGESYTHCSGIWDGAPASYKTCPDCVLLRFQIELTLPRDWEEGIYLGGICEWLTEARDPGEFAEEFGRILRKRNSKWRFHSEASRRLFSFHPADDFH